MRVPASDIGGGTYSPKTAPLESALQPGRFRLRHPARQKNYQSGKLPMQETDDDARIATVKLHTGPDRPSKLVLPVRSDGGS